jgi:hypothetical protein
MSKKCCIPECRGNYEATEESGDDKVSVFKFPDDPDLWAKWFLRSLERIIA